MNFDIHKRTIYLTVVGSYSYGMARPESDVDVRGICIPTPEYFHGYVQRFEQNEGQYPRHSQATLRENNRHTGVGTVLKRLESICGRPIPEDEAIDSTVYGIIKFFKLAADCNPNIIELLFEDPTCHVITTKFSVELMENRDLFLSMKARYTFSGYAHSQLKRIRTHRKWLLNPPAEKPEREKFGLVNRTVIPRDQLQAAENLIKKKIEGWIFLDDELPREVLDSVRKQTVEAVRDIWSGLASDCYQLDHKGDEIHLSPLGAPLTEDQEFDLDKLEHSAGKLLGYDENFLEYLDRERKYKSALRQFKQYEHWKKTRNAARAELEAKYGYDCYVDDTEFLTSKGWRKFDDVGDLPLATVDKEFKVEFQTPEDRFDGVFSGNLYMLGGQHMDVAVTPNHRMLFRKVERKSGKEYPWVLEEAALLPDTFDVVRTISPRTSTFHNDQFDGLPIPQLAIMRLMGWYLSDGTAEQRDGKSRAIKISQKSGGKLHWSMSRFASIHKNAAQVSLYKYKRKPNEFRPYEGEELILSVRNKNVVDFIVDNCGTTKNKRIPRWAFNLSKRLMSKLIKAACGGDGYKREHKTKTDSFTYYSSLESLADDIQEMAFMCGYESAKWGPFDEDGNAMWQVHIRMNVDQFKRCVRCKNVQTIVVSNKRIVCFSVPNGTLVTRRNGKISIHGNSKHASHLVRLLRMAREIMSEGKVIVRRPDADELKAIRNGEWTFDQLMEWADQAEKDLTDLYESGKCKLPKKPNHNKLDALCTSLVERALEQDALL